jgi:hypothetical protein
METSRAGQRALAPWTSWPGAPRVARRFLRRTDVSAPPLWTSPTPGFLRPFPRRVLRLRASLRRPRHAPGHGGRKPCDACAPAKCIARRIRGRGCVGARSPRPSRRARRPFAAIEPPPAPPFSISRRHCRVLLSRRTTAARPAPHLLELRLDLLSTNSPLRVRRGATAPVADGHNGRTKSATAPAPAGSSPSRSNAPR